MLGDVQEDDESLGIRAGSKSSDYEGHASGCHTRDRYWNCGWMIVAQDVFVVDLWILGINSIPKRPDLKDVWSNVLACVWEAWCNKAFHDNLGTKCSTSHDCGRTLCKGLLYTIDDALDILLGKK